MGGLSSIARKRRAFAENSSFLDGRFLELGAFDNPMFRKEDGDNVKYVDWHSKAELIELSKTSPNRDISKIVDVDYIIKSNELSKAIGDKFDLVCASHVIEHIPDMCRWFEELSALLTPRGQIFLAIPDKRYTFDFFRQISRATEFVRAYQEKLVIPSMWQLADHFYYHQKVNVAEIWAGKNPAAFQPRFSLAHALDLAERKSSSYTDAHCWVFTSDTFCQLIDDLRSSGIVNLEVTNIQHPLEQTNEFMVMLRKTPT